MEGTVQEITRIDCSLFTVDTIAAEIHGASEVECTLSDISTIEAEISSISEIQADLSSISDISATITLPEGIDGLPYSGKYNVIPDFEFQTLETKNRRLKDDVTVEAIRVSRTTNPSGGTTVYIGGMLNGQ